jgi:hypothetical protein
VPRSAASTSGGRSPSWATASVGSRGVSAGQEGELDINNRRELARRDRPIVVGGNFRYHDSGCDGTLRVRAWSIGCWFLTVRPPAPL